MKIYFNQKIGATFDFLKENIFKIVIILKLQFSSKYQVINLAVHTSWQGYLTILRFWYVKLKLSRKASQGETKYTFTIIFLGSSCAPKVWVSFKNDIVEL